MEIGRPHLERPVKQSEGKGRESVVAIPRFLCGSPHLCRLRTEGLVPVSKYWTYRSHAGDMGPINLVAGRSLVLGLSLLLQWLCWERDWCGSCEPLSRAERWSQEHFFSGAVVSVQDCRRLIKGCHVWGLPVESVHRTYVDWSEKRTWHVGQIFSCRVYINSNHRDSRI
jgi:hypothetical protein